MGRIDSDFKTIGDGMSREQFQAKIIASVPESAGVKLAEYYRQENAKPDPVRQAELTAQEEARAREAMKSLRLAQQNACGLSGDQWRNTFASYVPSGTPDEIETQRAALAAARRFAARWPKRQKGLMLHGRPGIGKDHLLHAITQAVLDKPGVGSVIYRYSLDIGREMMAEWERHEDPETACEERLRGVRLVLIGDIHRLFARQNGGVLWQRIEDAMWRLVNQAESTGRPVLCATSNYSLQEWEAICSEALISRLVDCMDWLEIRGPDRRRMGDLTR